MNSPNSIEISARFALPLILLGGLSAYSYLSMQPNVVVMLLFSLAALLMQWLLFKFLSLESVSEPNQKLWVLGTSMILVVMGLCGKPMFEDDFYRYLWDAYVFAEIGNPYSLPPSSYFGFDDLPGVIDFKAQSLLDYINYPDVPTIYGPVLQYVHLYAYFFAPADVWGLKLIYSVFYLISVWILLKLAPARWVMLFAFSPLVFKEVLLSVHSDVVGISFLVIAYYALNRGKFILLCVALACAIGSKVFALVVVPFYLLLLPKSLRIKSVLFVSTLTFFIYLPFVVWGQGSWVGLASMASAWQFNSLLFFLFGSFVNADDLRLLALMAFTLYFLFTLFWRVRRNYLENGLEEELEKQNWKQNGVINFKSSRQNLYRTIPGEVSFGVFLLLSPVVNAWYLLWLLPFAVVNQTSWVWPVSLLVLLSYFSGINLPGNSDLDLYEIPEVILVIEYGLISCVLLYFAYKNKRS